MRHFLVQLSSRGVITPDQLQQLGELLETGSDSAVRLLYRQGFLDQQVLASELSAHLRIPLAGEDWPEALVLGDVISPRFLREHRVLPLAADDDSVTVAVSDPADSGAIDAIRIASERHVDLRIATENQILSQLDRLLDQSIVASARGAAAGPASDDEQHLRDLALDAPVIDLVNRLFREAAASRATDLHIEPAKNGVAVRKRVDGLLHDAGFLAHDMGRAAVSRIKILTQLNIAERRLPQDGRARVRAGDREYDIRVATIPTIHGESVSIRFLSATNAVPKLNALGLKQRDLRVIEEQSSHAHGLIVVTGPTGSGKTTTLAAVLNRLNNPTRKILTIEDPVEYQVEGINQIQVRPEIGLTFAATLRSLLRHDPDIIMVGEMRDSETAKIGVNAALTGHLVLTTLHTNSAAGAVTRLLDFDVQSYLIASTLRCVVAQRLVRKLCVNCRSSYVAAKEELDGVPADCLPDRSQPVRLWRSQGCQHCGGTGYLGRAAIFEILVADERMRGLIRPQVDAATIASAARASGMSTMLMDGFAKCLEGVTTLAELGRVTSED